MKLFRHRRKKLIFLGKFKSYVLYALGEIVLIVIAVTIAWKINDINDIRKDRLYEEKILENLSEELETNSKLLKRIIDEDTQRISYLQGTLNYIGKTPTELTQGAKDTIISVANREVSILDSSTKSILSTNKLELI